MPMWQGIVGHVDNTDLRLKWQGKADLLVSRTWCWHGNVSWTFWCRELDADMERYQGPFGLVDLMLMQQGIMDLMLMWQCILVWYHKLESIRECCCYSNYGISRTSRLCEVSRQTMVPHHQQSTWLKRRPRMVQKLSRQIMVPWQYFGPQWKSTPRKVQKLSQIVVPRHHPGPWSN